MWTAKIKNKIITNGVLFITVEYANAKKAFSETYNLDNVNDDKWLEKRVADKIKQIVNLENYAAGLIEGESVNTEPEPQPIETDEQRKEREFNLKLNQLEEKKRLVGLEVLMGTEPSIELLKTEAQALAIELNKN